MEDLIKLLINSDLKLIEKQTGIPYDRMYKWTKGKAKPKIEDYNVLMKYFNGKSSNEKSTNMVEERRAPYNKVPKSNAIKIGEMHFPEDESPYIDLGNDQFLMVVPKIPIRASMGYREHYQDEQYIEENYEKHYFPVTRQYRGKYYAFVADGESMDDGTSEAIIEGSTVTARDIKKDLWKSKFHLHSFKDFVIVMPDAILIKRIIEHNVEEGYIVCHSLNPDKRKFGDFTLHLDECLQIMNIVNVTQPR